MNLSLNQLVSAAMKTILLLAVCLVVGCVSPPRLQRVERTAEPVPIYPEPSEAAIAAYAKLPVAARHGETLEEWAFKDESSPDRKEVLRQHHLRLKSDRIAEVEAELVRLKKDEASLECLER